MSMTIRMLGPLFNGVADAECKAALLGAQRELAEYAEFQWRMNLDATLQHPSEPPVYESKIEITKRGSDLVVSDGWPDSEVEYGPWLEGVGTRNADSTFKGYSNLRKAAKQVAYKSPEIVKPVIDKFIAKANGA